MDLSKLDIQRPSRDTNSSQLVNFPYAFTAFATLGGGVLAVATALMIFSLWLAFIGTTLAFLGCLLYGLSLCS